MMSKLTRNLESHDPTILSLADEQTQQTTEDEISRPLVVESFPSDSENSTILLDDPGCDDLNLNPTLESDPSGKCKKKKKKGKKKKTNLGAKEEARDKSDVERENSDSNTQLGYIGMSPFTSSGSAMQNKIKLVYDEFVKCHDSNQLRLKQVVEFAEYLSNVKNELQHRVDAIKRKYLSTKALLYSADRSPSNKVGEQVTKFNLELQRLKDDGSAFNFIQDQFVKSPAYNKFLEIRAEAEEDKLRLETTTISFEELLAKEKNDSFWRKNGKSGQCSRSNSN